MATYKSEITGEIYEGELSSYYNHHDDCTQLYIGEALVQEIGGCLDSDEVDDYFLDYYPEIHNEKSMLIVYQYDQWFTSQSRVLFGVFVDKTFEEVESITMDGFEGLHKGFKDDVYRNGTNQWITDKYDFGFSIEEIKEVNVFGEQ